MNDCVDLTRLIQCAQNGDGEAMESLFAAAYRQLRMLARARLRIARRDTLMNTTSLVHEFYLRFAGSHHLELKDREHFMRYASKAMRSVIVDYVRRRLADRRGAGGPRVTLSPDFPDKAITRESEILFVHEALDELEKLSPRMARVVEMRYFAGLTESQIAQVLSITDRTVRRDWEKARLLLFMALRPRVQCHV
jgi:RNA polymerase sigma factor (TIGR02999 family)